MKLRRRAVAPSLWDLVEAFYLARTSFDEVYQRYEARVLAHAAERGVDRTELRLDHDAVSKLLDFAKLESLRNGPLHDLKDIAHALFRRKTSTDKLDRYASEIFHELSILKEEQYKVSTFAPEYQKRNELDEYESILEEVHKEFPRKVHNIHDVFEKARWRLEAILKRSTEETIFLRSLALFGDALLEKAYPGGADDLHWLVFAGGPLEGHLRAARSFARAGFLAHARTEAAKAVLACARVPDGENAEKVDKETLARLGAEAQALATRLETMTAVGLVQAFAEEAAVASRPPSEITAIMGDDLPPASADDLDDTDVPSSLETRAG
jgi:hypothetical protein